MNIEIVEPKLSPCIGRNATSQHFDWPSLIKQMKQSHNWESGELDTIILFKNKDKQILLTALQEGTEINSFQSSNSITFQTIEGELEFHTQHKNVTLSKGQKLTLHENINYSLTNHKETVFLLTIANEAIAL